jgi:hypothetical protein
VTRPEPNYPKRSAAGAARHAKKQHVRGAYLDPMPKSSQTKAARCAA